MERTFGRSFDDVRVHTDDASARAARDLRANAFTVGGDIYFDQGRYDPKSDDGRHLLAHELAHVAQSSTQNGGSGRGSGSHRADPAGLALSRPGEPAEVAADRAADAAVRGEPIGDVGSAPGHVVHRQGGDSESATHTVEPGDTLWGISDDYYGDPTRWNEIAEHNQIGDPTTLQVGSEVEIPGAENHQLSQDQNGEHVDPAERSRRPGQQRNPPPGAGTVNHTGPTTSSTPDSSTSSSSMPGGSGAGMCLAPWATVKGGFPWDQEIAFHDQWKSGGVSISVGGGDAGASPFAGMSQRDMALQALGQGGLQGLAQGGVTVLLDTLINVGSKRIPYLSGMVELGRLTWGIASGDISWQGIADSAGQAYNTACEAWDKICNGSFIEKIEGILDIGDMVASAIGTITSVCWALAGLGFVLSFIPGMQWLIPFVALAAQWGATLGGIGTALDLALSLIRALVIAWRAAELLSGSADPAEAERLAEELQLQTTRFVDQWAQRAGDSARSRAESRLRGSGNQDGGSARQQGDADSDTSRRGDSDGPGTARTGSANTGSGGASPALGRARRVLGLLGRGAGLMTGAIGGRGPVGSGFSSRMREGASDLAQVGRNARVTGGMVRNTAASARSVLRGEGTTGATGRNIALAEGEGIEVYRPGGRDAFNEDRSPGRQAGSVLRRHLRPKQRNGCHRFCHRLARGRDLAGHCRAGIRACG